LVCFIGSLIFASTSTIAFALDLDFDMDFNFALSFDFDFNFGFIIWVDFFSSACFKLAGFAWLIFCFIDFIFVGAIFGFGFGGFVFVVGGVVVFGFLLVGVMVSVVASLFQHWVHMGIFSDLICRYRVMFVFLQFGFNGFWHRSSKRTQPTHNRFSSLKKVAIIQGQEVSTG